MSLNGEKLGLFVWCSTLRSRRFGRESVSHSQTNWQESVDLIRGIGPNSEFIAPVYSLQFTQSLSFLLVIERLERARCTTTRETGVSKVDGHVENGKECPSSPFSARLCLSPAPVPQLLWTRKERDCVQSSSDQRRL